MTDLTSAVVPDADVEISDNTKGTIQTTKTDREGVYRFSFLPPARYTLTVTRDGFRKEIRAVTVLSGPPVTVNVTLEIARENTTVKVMGEAPLIQAENGDVSTTVNQKQINEVPNPGNDLTYIAQTAPGMVMNVENQFGANFSSLGMPGTSNLFTIDGLNQNDNGTNIPLVGAAFLLLGQNEIQEATVVSIGYSGQFGGAAGANVNYVTKSGGKEFHGNAQYYWNGRVFNANDWFNNNNHPQYINNAGQIVGYSNLSGDTTTHGFLWEKGVMTDLGTLPGDVMSFGEAINGLGEVGGYSCDTAFNCRAFLWHGGKMTDLNTLLPLNSSLFLVDVLSINSRGEFVGDAVELSTGENHAYLATPSQSGTETELAAPNTQSLKLVLPENVRRMLRQRLGRRFGTSQLSVK